MKQTKLNAVIGFPLTQSLSPEFHNAQYAKRGHDAVLRAFENEDLAALVQTLRTEKIGLTAVTLPFKEKILPFLDELDPLAERLQSVNTVLQKDGRLLGFNTDYHGISKALEDVELVGKNVLLLGAGGAAHAVAAYINDQGAKLFCLNRDPARAEELVQRFGGESIQDPGAHDFDVIINATPAELPLEAKFLHAGQTVFDLVYNPEETRFLRAAKEAGAETRSGLLMFEAQALEQIRLWEDLVLNS